MSKIKLNKYLIFLLLIPVLALNGCFVEMYDNYKASHKKKPVTSNTSVFTEDVKDTRLTGEVFGIVTKINSEDKLITIRDINTNALLAYFYSGSTDIRDKYDKIMSVALLEPGDIVEGSYFIDNNLLESLSISSRAWSNLRVYNWSYDRNNNCFRIGTQTYSLYDFCVVTQDKEIIDIRELAQVDELIVRGYDNTIYSIDVLKGHGYVNLANDSFFIGGIVTIGRDIGLEITKDMLIVAKEGKHVLSVTKKGVGGSVDINVKRGREIFVDIGSLGGEAVMHSSISFMIKPEGAKLYIDGREKSYEGLVELEFGTYRIAVEAEGYVPYMGDLVVSDTFMKKAITLGLEKSGEKETTSVNSGEKETTTAEGDNTENTTVSGNEDETVIYTGEKDVSKYKIYVEAPTGAEVYFDSEYMGIAPLSFAKQSGIHTIIFRKSGSDTKSYTIEISSEACDEYFSFLPMQKTDEE